IQGELKRLRARFAALDPNYVPFAPRLTMAQIRGLAQAAAAIIVDFRVTSEGTYAFLAGPEDKTVSRRQVVEIPAVTSESVARELEAWLNAHYSTDGNWPAYLEQGTERLYQQVLRPVHDRLRELYPSARRLVLSPSQGLSLLPLHAAWWETGAG